ncbi:MAG: DNA cytosine methyltransferase [Phycisphaerae bacterium]|nr:DNA cytosine methyltransferase [Phycisphaerae bacterium]
MVVVRTVDLFCGAGGSSWGARLGGAEIVAGFDMSALAGTVFADNFPEARFQCARLEDLDPKQVARSIGPIDLLLASPECTNHSPAKGGRPRCERSRETAFQVVRFARGLEPRWIVVENVVSMRKWSRYGEFVAALRDMGFRVSEQILNAVHFGVPQTRRRLFLLCDREQGLPTVNGNCQSEKSAAEVIDENGGYRYSPLRTRQRAAATIERAERAITTVGKGQSFLLVYYGSDKAGGWQRLERPLRTVTTLDRFAYVKPTGSGHMMRMLQVPELKAAMGMPMCFRIERGSRRERIKLIGNAVCPPVMRTVVRVLLREA